MSIYDYDYDFLLKVEDLRGMEHTVKVKRAYQKMAYNPNTRKQERKIALAFENRRKNMLLNATQAAEMERITGTEHEQKWAGVEITIAPAVAFNNKQTIKIMAQPSGAAVLFKAVQQAEV
ncbi:MAG: hypothetical protein HY864_00720 [Chloroflexi bacterium]|nr:hypothetical protein [Chloroflexota bacterium]